MYGPWVALSSDTAAGLGLGLALLALWRVELLGSFEWSSRVRINDIFLGDLVSSSTVLMSLLDDFMSRVDGDFPLLGPFTSLGGPFVSLLVGFVFEGIAAV